MPIVTNGIGKMGTRGLEDLPGYITDHAAPSGNPKATASGAGIAGRAPRSYRLTPPQPLHSRTQRPQDTP